MQREHCYCVYIITNKFHRVLYTGVTGELENRILHKQKQIEGFATRYNLTMLVYYEEHEYIEDAIIREKEIKG